MTWRLSVFVATAPLGALAYVVLTRSESLAGLIGLAALVGGAFALFISGLAARMAEPDARGAGLAMGSTAGFAALPCVLTVCLGLGPEGVWLLLGCFALLGVALLTAPWNAPAPLQWFGRALAWTSLGLLVVVVSAGAIANRAPDENADVDRRAAAIYDFDAMVATVPLPDCAQRLETLALLASRGAHPRIGPDGSVWFDALPESIDAGTTRQIHRLDPATGEVECVTCGQPGNNVWPAVAPNGRSVIFESDRDASWRRPLESELYRLDVRRDRRVGARRLTHSAGPDEQPVLGPSGKVVVWSRGRSGRRTLVSSTIVTGHGGLMLGSPGVFRSSAGHVAPLGWTPDARALVLVEGNRFAPMHVVAFDRATGRDTLLARGAPFDASVGTNADGGWLAVATGAVPSVLGRLPVGASHLLELFERTPSPGASTHLATGPPTESLRPVALDDDITGWGEPSGVALSASGTTVFLAQRRAGEAGVEERILELELGCAGGAVARAEPHPGEASARDQGVGSDRS